MMPVEIYFVSSRLLQSLLKDKEKAGKNFTRLAPHTLSSRGRTCLTWQTQREGLDSKSTHQPVGQQETGQDGTGADPRFSPGTAALPGEGDPDGSLKLPFSSGRWDDRVNQSPDFRSANPDGPTQEPRASQVLPGPQSPCTEGLREKDDPTARAGRGKKGSGGWRGDLGSAWPSCTDVSTIPRVNLGAAILTWLQARCT